MVLVFFTIWDGCGEFYCAEWQINRDSGRYILKMADKSETGTRQQENIP
jgi:hypothetical protein